MSGGMMAIEGEEKKSRCGRFASWAGGPESEEKTRDLFRLAAHACGNHPAKKGSREDHGHLLSPLVALLLLLLFLLFLPPPAPLFFSFDSYPVRLAGTEAAREKKERGKTEVGSQEEEEDEEEWVSAEIPPCEDFPRQQ